jgi:hypothetical protein
MLLQRTTRAALRARAALLQPAAARQLASGGAAAEFPGDAATTARLFGSHTHCLVSVPTTKHAA